MTVEPILIAKITKKKYKNYFKFKKKTKKFKIKNE